MTWDAYLWRRVAAALAFGVVVAVVIVAAVTGRHDSPTPPASPLLMTSQTGDLTGSMVAPLPTLVTLVPGLGEVGHGLEVRPLP